MQAETVVLMITIVVSVLGSSLGTIRILLHQMNLMESRLTDKITENRAAIHENRIRIERCSAHLEEHDRRFDAMDARFDRMDERFDRMDARMDKMDGRMDKMDGRMDGRMDRMDGRMDARMDKMDGRFDKMIARQEDHQNETQKVRETVARVEGFLMGSGEFRLSTPSLLPDEKPTANG